MSGFLLRIIINGVILVTVVVRLPGIFVDTLGGILLAAAIIGLANAAIRPLLSMASIPMNAVTLGAITLFINFAAPLLVTHTLPGVCDIQFYNSTGQRIADDGLQLYAHDGYSGPLNANTKSTSAEVLFCGMFCC